MNAQERGRAQLSHAPKKRFAPPSYQPPRPREKVLILAHGDNYIEAFAEKHVDIRIEPVPYTGTVRGECLAEDYLDLTLPHRYRELFWPGKLRAADKLRVVRPSDLAKRDHELALLRAMERLAGPQQERAKVWTL